MPKYLDPALEGLRIQKAIESPGAATLLLLLTMFPSDWTIIVTLECLCEKFKTTFALATVLNLRKIIYNLPE